MRRTPLARTSQMPPGPPPARRTPLRSVRTEPRQRAREGRTRVTGAGPAAGRAESFPRSVAALIDARDPWCVHCGTPSGLQRHHRRIKGMGGDGRDHTDCACNAVRLCWLCHSWAHSGGGQREAEAEGLIIPRSTLEPWAWSVLVHLEGDRGGLRRYPSCDGQWLDYVPEAGAA